MTRAKRHEQLMPARMIPAQHVARISHELREQARRQDHVERPAEPWNCSFGHSDRGTGHLRRGRRLLLPPRENVRDAGQINATVQVDSTVGGNLLTDNCLLYRRLVDVDKMNFGKYRREGLQIDVVAVSGAEDAQPRHLGGG